MNHPVERNVVDQDQVVAGSAAPHGEAGKFAVRYQPRQAVKRPQDVAASACGTAQFLPVKQRVAHCAMGIGNPRAGRDDDFLERFRAGKHLEVQRSQLAADHADAGLLDRHQARAVRRDVIEPDRQIAQCDRPAGLRATRYGFAVAAGHGHGYAFERSLSLLADHGDAQPALCALRHRGR